MFVQRTHKAAVVLYFEVIFVLVQQLSDTRIHHVAPAAPRTVGLNMLGSVCNVRAERRNVSVPKGRNPVRNSKFDLPLSSVAETHYLNLI